MIQHILHWSYREDLPGEEKARLEDELEGLARKVPSLRKLEWGPVVGGRNQSFSHTFVMHFDDMSALEGYTVHPDHQLFAKAFREACSAQMVVDFEVMDGA